jgi:transcriptional regulator with XRE-family HTH domain
VRLQRLRERHALSQAALARSLGISASYLNQIERNQRPLTLAVRMRLEGMFGAAPELADEQDPAALPPNCAACWPTWAMPACRWPS